MKIDMCDVCLADKKMVPAKYRVGLKNMPKSSVCERHEDHFKGMDSTAFLNESIRLGDAGIRFSNGLLSSHE